MNIPLPPISATDLRALEFNNTLTSKVKMHMVSEKNHRDDNTLVAIIDIGDLYPSEVVAVMDLFGLDAYISFDKHLVKMRDLPESDSPNCFTVAASVAEHIGNTNLGLGVSILNNLSKLKERFVHVPNTLFSAQIYNLFNLSSFYKRISTSTTPHFMHDLTDLLLSDKLDIILKGSFMQSVKYRVDSNNLYDDLDDDVVIEVKKILSYLKLTGALESNTFTEMPF